MDLEAALNDGDVCRDCEKLGLVKHLRYFKINLDGGTLLKCESNECMYPYNNEMYSSDEEEKTIRNLVQTNSLSVIHDMIDQSGNKEEFQNTNNTLQINDNVTEQVTHFDITFLDDLNVVENKTVCKPEIPVESREYFVDDCNVKVVENKYLSLPTFNSIETVNIKDDKMKFANFTEDANKVYPMQYEISYEKLNTNELTDNELNSGLSFPEDTFKDHKKIINTESKETVKCELPCYTELPTSSKNCTALSDLPSKDHPSADISLQLPAKTKSIKYRPRKKITDIPKADIAKGNALLKKLAEIDVNEISPKWNSKCKLFRRRTAELIAKKKEKTEEPSQSFSQSADYSFDKLSKILLSKRQEK